MVIFRKQEDCPASQNLLSYQLGDLPAGESLRVARHLRTCEFCAAEIDFYEHYPQSDETNANEEKSAIPEPLYQLAESLLKRGKNTNALKKLLADTEDVSFSKR